MEVIKTKSKFWSLIIKLGLIPGRETAVCRYLAADDENNLSEWTLNLVLRLWGKNVSNTSVLSFWLKEEVDIQHLTTDFEKFLWFRHYYSRIIINKFSFVNIMYQSNIFWSHNEYEVYIVFYVKYLFWRFVVHLWNLVCLKMFSEYSLSKHLEFEAYRFQLGE